MTSNAENLLMLTEERLSSLDVNKNAKFVDHPYRFVMFAQAALLAFVFGTFNTAFVPISDALFNSVGVTKSEVLLSSSFFLAGNVAFCPFVYPIVKQKGLRNTILLAIALGFLGAWIRCFYRFGFLLVLLGQFMIGWGACLIVNTQMEFCFTWFHPATRPLFLSVVVVSSIFGGGFGNLIPLLFVSDTEKNPDKVKEQLDFYLRVCAIFVFAFMATLLALFRDAPPKGFGNLEKQPEDKDDAGFITKLWFYIKYCFRFSVFRNIFALYVIGNSNLVILASVVNDAVKFFDYPSFFGSIAALTVIIFGLISSIGYSVTMMKYKHQGHHVAIMLSGGVYSMFLCLTFFDWKWSVMSLACVGLFGICSFPITPITMEMMTRKFVTVPNYVTNTIMVLSSQLFTLLVQIVTSWLGVNVNGAVMLLLVMFFFAVGFLFVRDIDHDVSG